MHSLKYFGGVCVSFDYCYYRITFHFMFFALVPLLGIILAEAVFPVAAVDFATDSATSSLSASPTTSNVPDEAPMLWA